MSESNYWKEAYEGAAKETSGIGVYGVGIVSLGFFVFADGYQGNDRIEKCFFGLKKYGDYDAAKKAAQAFSRANGDANARWCNALRLYQTRCVRANGKSVSESSDFGSGWSSDQFEPVALWPLKRYPDQPSQAKARMDALEELDVRPDVEFYGRFVKQNDPYKVAMDIKDGRPDNDGNPRFKNFWNVVEVFESEEAMMQHVTISTETATVSTAGQASAPEGWDMDSWKSVWPELHDAKENGKSLPEIAGDYGVRPGDVASALSQYIPM